MLNLIFIFLMFIVTVVAHEHRYDDAYTEALQRIEEAHETGALTLSLAHLGLEQLPPEIGKLQSLQTLNLSANRLKDLPPEIGNLENLEHLNLEYSNLIDLPVEFGNLKNLKTLNLFSNQLSSFPPQLGELRSLEYLTVVDNSITDLPKEIGQLVNLRELHLAHNSLTALPAEIGQLLSLEIIDIGDNVLRTLPGEIGDLTKLHILIASYNDLVDLPPEFGQLTNLVHLELYENSLTTLPDELSQLDNLKWLGLSNNDLSELPMAVTQLESLETLSLGDNALEFLPDSIGNLVNLESLYLENNRLKSLPPQIGSLLNLKLFYVFGNRLSQFPIELGRLKRLEILYAHNNALVRIPVELGELNNLQRFGVADNQITHLPNSLGSLDSLKSFGVSGNPIMYPPADIVAEGDDAIITYLRLRQLEEVASAQENVTRPAVRIAFISFNHLYIADGDGSNLQKISIGLYQPQWSPDGSHLAFFSHACGETWALCLVDAEGENLQDVVSGLHIPETLFWSPDGEVIAYAARGENGNANIYTVRSDGTELKRITDCSECRHSVISWSPDGRQIAILSKQGTAPNGRVMSNIYVVNKDGSNLRQVTNCNECAYYQSVVWSPDSTKIAFVAYESGRKLYMANLDEGSLRLLSDNYGDSIIWSQDSTSIGAITNEGICLLLEGECLVCDCGQVWSGNHPLLSSDGSQILFNSREQIHVIDIDGSNEKQLTFDEHPLGQLGASIDPAWSPDGNHIAFRSTREGRWALYVMNVDGSRVSKIADEVGWFAWQPLQVNEEIDT